MSDHHSGLVPKMTGKVIAHHYPEAEAIAPSSTDLDAFQAFAQRAGMASEETSEHRSLTGMQHQSAASTDEDEYDPEGPGRDVVESTDVEIASGLSIVTLREFKAAARSLKAAELAFHAAQLAYADAVKRLSEEAVK